jgi:hypothetical protein
MSTLSLLLALASDPSHTAVTQALSAAVARPVTCESTPGRCVQIGDMVIQKTELSLVLRQLGQDGAAPVRGWNALLGLSPAQVRAFAASTER